MIKVIVMEYEARGNNYKLCEVEDLEMFVQEPLYKILTFADPSYLQTHFKEMRKPFEKTLSCMFTGPFYYEFCAKGIDKAKALDTVLSKLGYNRGEIMAFGDGENDISMLSYAEVGGSYGQCGRSVKKYRR